MNDAQTWSTLIIGAGSIGTRHARNLNTLGIGPLTIWDPLIERATQIARDLTVQTVTSLEQGLADKPKLVFVCSPPSFHIPQALQAVQAGAHVFVEKPLSDTSEGVAELTREAEQKCCIVQVGYNLRFLPAIQTLKQLIDDGAIGRVLWMRAEFGQYLPDWRPSQDYRQNYTAQRRLGGGIILDASHEIDYVLWLLGRPVTVQALADKVSDLEMDVEDCASLLMRFPSGAQADVHLDCVQRVYSRGCKIVGENGTIEWSFGAAVRLYQVETRTWKEIPCPSEPAQMYVDEVRHFLSCVETGTQPVSNLESASLTLQVALTAKQKAK
jgi:predicted dehydrogenase